jgi:hypothetical protein
MAPLAALRQQGLFCRRACSCPKCFPPRHSIVKNLSVN